MQKQQNTTATAKPFWLYGKISRDQAEKLLTPKKPGKFVVRESTNYRGDFTLSVVRYDLRVEHYRIQRRGSYLKPVKFTIDEESYFESLGELVKHYQEDADGICARLENISPTKPANERVQAQEAPHRYLLTAAIDFGTTYSGYAYAHHAEEKGTIHVNANWKSGSQSFKVPTAILFDEQKNFLSFGFAAEDEYTEFADSEEEMKYFLFHRFKMVLYEEKNISRDIIMKSQNGKTMLAIDVFAAAIKFLKEHLIRTINDMKYGEEVTAENVKWVLTVPAIWSSTARHFMTEAASKAGIEEKHLLIALEPECASVYCMNLPIGKLSETVDINRKGCRYMVVDIGGGTVDITMHEIIGENQILELHKATGNDSGGTKVDKVFEQYLSKIFTENVVDTIKRNSPSEWLEMERDFEATKRSVGKEADKETTILLLKPCLHEAYEEIENISLVKAVKEKKINHKNATLQGKNRLRVPSSDFKDMILTVASNIKNFVHDLLNNDSLPRMDYVVLVGGFSKSELVLSEIRKIAGKIPVVRPPEAELAVVKGAVLFGQNPNLVTSRKSRRTYGIDVTRKFLATDPEELAITDEYGEIRCQKCFDPLVTVNETVKTGEVRYRSFYPFKSVDSVMPIRIYATNRENVRYCNEKDVLHVATFNVKLAKVTGENKREVKCEFHFGETTMRVDAIDVTSGHSCMETVDFLSERS